MKSPALCALSLWLGAAVAVVAEAPKPLPAGAVTSDWPSLLGPAHNATSPETKLLHEWPKAGPKKLWEFEKGEGFACPAIVGDRLVIFHRKENQEVADCLEAATGKPLWSSAYEASYQDRYGSSNGPRTSAVIADGRVFTYGVTGKLHAFDLATGKVLWAVDAEREFALEPNFFGHGSTPVVVGNKLIVQLGGRGDVLAAALDVATGKTLWRAKQEWGSSYASPVPAQIHGRDCVLFFAGGESRPPVGGLVCVDAADGTVLCTVPHRASIAESVNASAPVVTGDRVFVTESYGSGGEMIQIGEGFKPHSDWSAERFGSYFMTPVVHDGAIIGCDGQSPRLAELVAYDVASGKELWRNDLDSKFGRCSLLGVDGGFLCLGEFGDLAWLDLSRGGVSVKQHAKLFNAPDTWTPLAISHGLLYVCQNERNSAGQPPRLLCYDLRAE